MLFLFYGYFSSIYFIPLPIGEHKNKLENISEFGNISKYFRALTQFLFNDRMWRMMSDSTFKIFFFME